ncbi:hypothetical protein GZH47_06000 [Paenibacillus rhizovicinus]|uniref:Uncharacterized protein n=1 Tax=Paenibacillus rhizovicinus TaxID=2704463 RepID=A0A6C0NW54_9BACL|nr:hypothetical protein [Paenibacillus rhizovicinus]QHW30444.1 hypothetical protein GZH47_06000 [Paenibacillus rhizovicinus]
MEEPRTKRPIFTPIVLILLTFSLIGNVFLYSETIQNDQTDRVSQGTEIIQSGNAAIAFMNQAAAQTEALVTASDIAARMTSKSGLLAAYRQSGSVTDFIQEAEDVNGKPFPTAKGGATEFLDQTLASLQAIGNHEGPLTAEEKTYLQGLHQVFDACKKELSAFQHDTINQEQSLLILVDKQWPQIAGKLLEQMKPADHAFKG